MSRPSGTAAPLTPEAFAAAVPVSRETLARLEAHVEALLKFQKAVNLVGAETLTDPWRRHVLDSAQLFPLLPPAPAGRPQVLLDLGAGAGFPGLVLAALAAGAGRALAAHLVEADARKAAFLREAARRMKLAVTVHNRRLESLAPFPADVITARAFAPLARLLARAAPFAGPGQPGPVLLLLKGRGAEEELTAAREGWKMRVERFPSITDPGAVVLRIEDLSRV